MVDDTRRRIAEISQAASEVLLTDVVEPSAFDNHPHPDKAYGFLVRLRRAALWGMEAETWDDTLLAHYVDAMDTIAYAVQIGADTYYEILQRYGLREATGDPDTCIYRELAKWDACIAGCDLQDPACRLTCFWNFTVLHSCRRCLRGF